MLRPPSPSIPNPLRRVLLGVVWAVVCVWVVGSGVGMGGCAQSRHDQVKEASRETQAVLDKELKSALAEDPSLSVRKARVDRLTSIKYQLSAANVALGAAPYVLKQPAELETAYTFLEEVYSTLSWNARLPADTATPLRPLPANPLPGKLNFMP